MSGAQRRLDKLEFSLTPKQAVLRWMAEAHCYDTVEAYVQSLNGNPDSAWPLPKLARQVTQAVQQAMKGKPKEVVAKEVRKALRDVLFLFHLQLQMNRKVIERERCWWALGLALATDLNAMLRERDLHHSMHLCGLRVSMELPYPLDAATAAAVDAARRHHVIPWDVLEDGDEIHQWVTDSFLAQGRTALPEEAFSSWGAAKVGGSQPSPQPELRDLFHDSADFQKFMTGEDFSNGLTDVNDAEYNAHYESIMLAMKEMAQPGTVVELPTVPHAFLREAPLVDGDWIDGYVVELAEWGAQLLKRGFVLEESQDSHPFAWYRIVDSGDRSAAGTAMREQMEARAGKHLARFPGRSREIEGRSYLRWTDYLKWRGRRARADLKTGLRPGLMASNWNQWVESAGGAGVAALSGVGVGRLDCHAGGCRYKVCEDSDELEEALRRRESLLRSLQVGKAGSDEDLCLRRKAEDWRRLAEGWLLELYRVGQAMDSLNRRYFDRQSGLFPGTAQGFARLAACAEEVVVTYYHSLGIGVEPLASKTGGSGPGGAVKASCIDIADLGDKTSREAVTEQCAHMVDMARAEALDTMGEHSAALAILER